MELFRIDFIHAIVSKFENAEPGRTALMKLAYFAQELYRIPLGYHFTLYSYGPFDPAVLSDLDIAAGMLAVQVSVSYHGRGYGYRIKASPEWIRTSSVSKFDNQITQVVKQFGHLKPSELELLSTIIYVDHEAKDRDQSLPMSRLVDKTHDIKPHFPKPVIAEKANHLLNDGLLSATKMTSVSAS